MWPSPLQAPKRGGGAWRQASRHNAKGIKVATESSQCGVTLEGYCCHLDWELGRLAAWRLLLSSTGASVLELALPVGVLFRWEVRGCGTKAQAAKQAQREKAASRPRERPMHKSARKGYSKFTKATNKSTAGKLSPHLGPLVFIASNENTAGMSGCITAALPGAQSWGRWSSSSSQSLDPFRGQKLVQLLSNLLSQGIRLDSRH